MPGCLKAIMPASSRSVGAFCVVLGLTALSPLAAHAQFFQNSTGIESPATTIRFSEVVLPQGTAVTDQYAAFGVTFTGLFYNTTPFTMANQEPPQLNNFPAEGSPAGPFSIFFATEQNSAAFALNTNAGRSRFRALNNGTVVFSSSAFVDLYRTDNYYGFTGITFDQIIVEPGGVNGAAVFDNLQLGTVAQVVMPEPSTLTLLAPVLPLTGMMLRRRKPRS